MLHKYRRNEPDNAESGSIVSYERPGNDATFLAALEQTAEIVVTFYKRF